MTKSFCCIKYEQRNEKSAIHITRRYSDWFPYRFRYFHIRTHCISNGTLLTIMNAPINVDSPALNQPLDSDICVNGRFARYIPFFLHTNKFERLLESRMQPDCRAYIHNLEEIQYRLERGKTLIFTEIRIMCKLGADRYSDFVLDEW